jgi:hypothetical protein
MNESREYAVHTPSTPLREVNRGASHIVAIGAGAAETLLNIERP